jgi:hypothetical protein
MANTPQHVDSTGVSGHSSITLSIAAAAAQQATQKTPQEQCCSCTAHARCDARCPCVARAEVCTSCTPGLAKCENRDQSLYTLGKGIKRAGSGTQAATGGSAAASTAANEHASPPATNIWTKSKQISPSKQKRSAAAAGAAAAHADRVITEQEPACVGSVREMCARMHGGAAAAGYNMSSAQLAVVEQLVEQAAHLHAGTCDLQKKLKAAVKDAADDRAALITSNKKLESTQKKFNEAESKLKQHHATASKAAAAASPSKKRVHVEVQEQRASPCSHPQHHACIDVCAGAQLKWQGAASRGEVPGGGWHERAGLFVQRGGLADHQADAVQHGTVPRG